MRARAGSRRSRSRVRSVTAPEPHWSVIVPTRGRPRQLERCLLALERLADRSRAELIIVDDDPAGGAKRIVAAAQERGVRDLHYIQAGGRGPAAARNVGVRSSRGEVLAFTDDDCEPEPGWLDGLRACLDADRAVAGRTVNVAPQRCAEVSQMVVRALEESQRKGARVHFAASNNVAFPRRAFDELGGFNERFPLPAAEDRDLCDRWIASGRSIVVSDDAVIQHRHELSLSEFWRQHYRYGRGAYEFHRLRRGNDEGSPRLQPSFYAALASQVRAADRVPRPPIAALAAISQIANAGGYAAAAISGMGRST